MSWKTFQEDVYNLTKKDIKTLKNRVLQNYRNAIKSIDELLKETYAKLTSVDKADYYNEMLKRDRLNNLLKQIKSDYSKYISQTYNDTSNILRTSFSNTYYRKLYAASWLVEKNVFGLLPNNLIELATKGTDEAFKNISKSITEKFGDKALYMPQKGSLVNLIKNNSTRDLNRINSAITQKLINGSSYTQTINEIRDIIGREFKDGKVIKYTGAKSNALRIIRTESNRIMNSADYAASKNLVANGVNTKRRLIATLDIATRRQSANMDGQTVDVGKPFKYPNGATAFIPGTTGVAKYDINDRESVINIINDIEPTVRIGRNPVTGKNEYFEYQDFDTWAKDKGLITNKYGEYIRK